MDHNHADKNRWAYSGNGLEQVDEGEPIRITRLVFIFRRQNRVSGATPLLFGKKKHNRENSVSHGAKNTQK